MLTYDQLSKMTGAPLKQAGLDVGVEYVPGETKETFLGRVMDPQLTTLAAVATPAEPEWLSGTAPVVRPAAVSTEMNLAQKVEEALRRVNEFYHAIQPVIDFVQALRTEKMTTPTEVAKILKDGHYVTMEELAAAEARILNIVLAAVKATRTENTDDDEAVEVKIEEELSELDQIRADLAALIQPKSKTKVTKPAAEEEKPKAKKAGRQVKIGA